MNRIRGYILVLSIIFLGISCNQQKKLVHKQNQAIVYQPSANIVRPEYIVYNTSDSISQLYIKIFINELLFNQANPEHKLLAKVRITCELTDITEFTDNTAIIDSFSKVRDFPYMSGKQYMVISLPIKSIAGKKYRLKVTVLDMTREIGNTGFLIMDKRNRFTSQDFKFIGAENGAPYFVHYIGGNDSVKIHLNRGVRNLYISYQREDALLPQPPFSSLADPVFTFKADSVWTERFDLQKWYRFPKEGIYLIKSDSSANEGYFIGNYGKSFPRITESKSMVSPIAYLTTTEEFKNIASEENSKLAVDNFWLKLSSSVDVSRELIRIYYARMHYANLYFTSFKPGWKTDRGMIYMIFGPPSNIRKTATFETWEYYIKQDAQSLLIKFIRVESPYSDNHYVMQRDASFTPFWRDAVYSWRTGKAYSLEK